MWKNIFLESCLLSALIFGGFYINAKFIKEEIYKNEEKTEKLFLKKKPHKKNFGG